MISGIYKLTFPSGLFYIGRSDDTDRRWQEHIMSFESGTASQRMQCEYNQWGLPNFELIYQCHPDHCDLVESAIIQYCDRSQMLNTQFPRRITPEEWETMCDCQELLELSTCDHLRLIFQNTELLSQHNLEMYNIKHQLKTKQEGLDQLKSSGVYIGDEANKMINYYKQENELLEIDLAETIDEVCSLQAELKKLKGMTLWQRLFCWRRY